MLYYLFSREDSFTKWHKNEFSSFYHRNVLITNRPLDYDVSNPSLRQFTLEIQVNDSLYAPVLVVIIDITDTNDNDPEFDNTSYAFELSEGVMEGYMIGRVRANDSDSGLFGSLQYSLSGEGSEV